MVINDKGLLKPDKFEEKDEREGYFSHRYLKQPIRNI